MKEKQPNKYNVQGISFPNKALLKDAKARAEELDLSLSKYAVRLIRADLAKRAEDSPASGFPQNDLKRHNPEADAEALAIALEKMGLTPKEEPEENNKTA